MNRLLRWLTNLACRIQGHDMHLDPRDESGRTWRCRHCGASKHFEPVYVGHNDSPSPKTMLTAAIKEGTPSRRLYADRDLGDETP